MKATNQEMSPMYGLAPEDAVDMLIADHKRVANLFADFKRISDEGSSREKAGIVARICQELTVHTQLEEELFYPAVREATGDEDQVDEAVVEHAGAKQLIAQLQEASPDDELYDAKVTVLNEQIDHHVEEEEGSMFPKARFSGVDTMELGAQMMARKAELKGGPGAGIKPPPAAKALSKEDDITARKPSRTAKAKAPTPTPTTKAKTASPGKPKRKR